MSHGDAVSRRGCTGRQIVGIVVRVVTSTIITLRRGCAVQRRRRTAPLVGIGDGACYVREVSVPPLPTDVWYNYVNPQGGTVKKILVLSACILLFAVTVSGQGGRIALFPDQTYNVSLTAETDWVEKHVRYVV